MEFVQKWPNWLRWALVFPIAFLAFIVSAILIEVLNHLFQEAPIFIVNLFCQITVGWASPFAYIWVGSRMTPKHAGSTSIVLATTFTVCSILLLIFSFYYIPQSEYLEFSLKGTIWYIIRLVLGIIGMVIACQDAFKYESLNNYDSSLNIEQVKETL